jgi:hypothetical protein
MKDVDVRVVDLCFEGLEVVHDGRERDPAGRPCVRAMPPRSCPRSAPRAKPGQRSGQVATPVIAISFAPVSATVVLL